jgi:hypothetical protein
MGAQYVFVKTHPLSRHKPTEEKFHEHPASRGIEFIA